MLVEPGDPQPDCVSYSGADGSPNCQPHRRRHTDTHDGGDYGSTRKPFAV